MEGAGVNFLCRQHGFGLKVVDAGVDYDFPSGLDIIDLKVAHGTRNYLHGPAMTADEMGALPVSAVPRWCAVATPRAATC